MLSSDAGKQVHSASAAACASTANVDGSGCAASRSNYVIAKLKSSSVASGSRLKTATILGRFGEPCTRTLTTPCGNS